MSGQMHELSDQNYSPADHLAFIAVEAGNPVRFWGVQEEEEEELDLGQEQLQSTTQNFIYLLIQYCFYLK